MSNLKALIKSPHIQIALATGVSIILMAYVSKRLLAEPMDYPAMAAPPFWMAIYELVPEKYKDKKIVRPIYWITAIWGTTALMILLYII
ncbi:hypothetical protein GF407_16605 [candidate division KSB1 bacterium]|nr:hypothetical protein [candidate division KSB1 bacterium]